MARINLLPWREEHRRERQRQFMSTLLMTSILGVVLVFLAGTVYDQKIKHQNFRNELVKKKSVNWKPGSKELTSWSVPGHA